MFKNFVLLFIQISFVTVIFAQADIEGENISPLSKIRSYTLPALDNSILKAYYSDQKNKPLRFAEARDIDLDFTNAGNWEELKSGSLIWRSVIHSPNAYSLNLAFTKFKLAGDAQLYIYNPEQSEILGPFTKEDNEEHLQLWTPLVSGDKLVVELQVSAEFLKTIQLKISRINHDFKDIQKGFQSGSCNLDVSCGTEDGWGIVDNYRDIISSVGAYTLNGIDQCTGVLINNTAQDCRPYFLTANHCNVNNSTAASIVVYWNYQNSECRQPGSLESGRAGDGQRINFNSGAQHRASLFDSDFTLIELDDPIDPQLDLHFAGWDLEYTLPDTSICIHHPNVEEKRISFDFDILTYDPTGQDTTYIQVDDWDIGTTEPGSSGSPLFNAKSRIIGQLLGGLAACGNDEYDSYGWINYSWEGGGNSTNRLKDWLDPVNSGVSALDGRSCSYNLELSTNYIEVCGQDADVLEVEIRASDFFKDVVSYSIVNATTGLDIELDFLEGPRDQLNILTISGLSNLSDDTYNVEIAVDDGENQAQSRIDFNVYNSIASIPELNEPLDGSLAVSTSLELSIKRTSNVINEFQLSDSPEFDNIIISQITEARLIEVNNLENDSEYFWRVKSSNICGNSDWSAINSFTTPASYCTVFKSSDGPFEIEESDAPLVNSTIDFPYPVVVQDINILNVKGTHNYISDLQFSLLFNNRSALLLDAVCDDEEDFNLGFDDESENLKIACPPVDSLLYIPEQSLDRFDNMVAGGEWKLQVEDLVNLDGGSFEEWQLEVCFSESLEASIVPANHMVSYCRDETAQVVLFYDLGSEGGEFEIKAFDRDNNELLTEFLPRLTSLNTVELGIETTTLSDEINSLRLELVSIPAGNTMALAVIQLSLSGEAEVPQIQNPVNGAVLKPESFDQLNWTDVDADYYDLIISRDEFLVDVVFQANGILGTGIDFGGEVFEPGVYYIRLGSKHNCGILYSDIIQITLDNDTSLNELVDSDIKVFPNPNKDYFFVELGSAIEMDVTFELYNIQGRKMNIEYERLSDGNFYFKHLDEPGGVYLLRILSGNNSIEKKLIRI